MTLNAHGTGTYTESLNGEDFGSGNLTWSASGGQSTIDQDNAPAATMNFDVSGDRWTLSGPDADGMPASNVYFRDWPWHRRGLMSIIQEMSGKSPSGALPAHAREFHDVVRPLLETYPGGMRQAADGGRGAR